MYQFLPRSVQLALSLAAMLLLSACGLFSNEYSYNASRDGRPTRDRPLYEEDRKPPVNEKVSPEDKEDEDVELIFEEEDTDTDEVIESPGIPSTEEALLRQEAVDYAKTFLGTKYKLGGTTPKGGFDCSGFTSYVMKQVDIALSRTSQAQENNGRKVRLKNVKAGDLIFYRRSPLGKVFHVSIVVANKEDGIYVIHSTSRGVVIDNVTKSSYWSPKISSARSVF
ncbi:MAG: C40 family peptidase [Phaeodactylibacter sp.]|uniref:C40 family peptidase n=1 Tax=Phaeodactylibacter sp. TaxID=1940289 RepID=UPI0032F043B3